jgi:hypothetical protein
MLHHRHPKGKTEGKGMGIHMVSWLRVRTKNTKTRTNTNSHITVYPLLPSCLKPLLLPPIPSSKSSSSSSSSKSSKKKSKSPVTALRRYELISSISYIKNSDDDLDEDFTGNHIAHVKVPNSYEVRVLERQLQEVGNCIETMKDASVEDATEEVRLKTR